MSKKKDESPTKKLLGRTLELGIISGVSKTLVPSSEAGMGQVLGAGLPIMTLTTMTKEIEGGATKVKITQGDSVFAASKKIARKYNLVGKKPERTTYTHRYIGDRMYCPTCRRILPMGRRVVVLNGKDKCPICGDYIQYINE